MDGYETVQLLTKILCELQSVNQRLLDLHTKQDESVRALVSIEEFGEGQFKRGSHD
jgi:uncharacterized protein YicC (UPF0701 family)